MSDTHSIHPFSHLYLPPSLPHRLSSYSCSNQIFPILKKFSLGSKSYPSFLSQSSFFRELSVLIVSTSSPPTDFSPQRKLLSALISPAWSSTVGYRALITTGAKGPLRVNPHTYKKHPFLFPFIYRTRNSSGAGTSSSAPNPSAEFKIARHHFLAM